MHFPCRLSKVRCLAARPIHIPSVSDHGKFEAQEGQLPSEKSSSLVVMRLMTSSSHPHCFSFHNHPYLISIRRHHAGPRCCQIQEHQGRHRAGHEDLVDAKEGDLKWESESSYYTVGLSDSNIHTDKHPMERYIAVCSSQDCAKVEKIISFLGI